MFVFVEVLILLQLNEVQMSVLQSQYRFVCEAVLKVYEGNSAHSSLPH